MSEVNWDAGEDVETPVDDAVEQHQALPGENGEPEVPDHFEVPGEANEADAAEQHWEIGEDDEDSYR